MTVIKNHFEVFLVTSKKQGNGFTHTCQLNVSCGQDSVSGIAHITVGGKKTGTVRIQLTHFYNFFIV
jgi:hypothetical protein